MLQNINGVPVEKILLNNKESKIVPDYFLESYLGKNKGDVAIKTARKKYKDGQDYIHHTEYDLRTREPINEYIGLTMEGFNKYFTSFRNHSEEQKEKAKNVRNALKAYNPAKGWQLNIFDVLRDDHFGISYILRLINEVINITEDELKEMIFEGNFSITADIYLDDPESNRIPTKFMYIRKNALKHVLLSLYNEDKINKDELVRIIRKIIVTQTSIENYA